MKNKWKLNPFIRISVLVSVFVFAAVIIAIGLFYYMFSIPEPNGLSLASWPDRFTDNFSFWIETGNGTVSVKESGLERLDEYGLWIQIIDESGKEVFSYKKPDAYPSSYSASELMTLGISDYENGTTVFVSSFEESGETLSYIVGFPYDIGKYMLYYNGETVSRLSPMFRTTILLILCGVVLFTILYGFWLTKHLSKVAKGINNISLHTYQPMKERGIFKGIYEALNKMDTEIRRSSKVREDTEQARREWISNITHDLKTPLSPVKGYAELLADGGEIDCQTAKEYGSIILKNVNHTEKLINDLKLTYQLDSGAIPYNPQKVRITSFMRELVIDVVNDPAYSGRSIEFESNSPDLTANIDTELFRRAIQNLVINALVHNSPDTKVVVSVDADSQSGICISVRDNGVGISDEAQAQLFKRYYRGTNTKESPEGTGLGLAIAKQIITLHGGDITVESSLGSGTEFSISFPQS